MNKQKLKEQLAILQKYYSDSLVTIGRIIEAIEEEEVETSIVEVDSSLSDLVDIFTGNYQQVDKKKHYPLYKRPEGVPEPMKGKDLMKLLEQAEKEGCFDNLGMSIDPSPLEEKLVLEAFTIMDYIKSMNSLNRQFYLLTPQKVLMEKYLDNQINSKDDYLEFFTEFEDIIYKKVIEYRPDASIHDMYNNLREDAFNKAFFKMRLKYPTIAKKVSYNYCNNKHGKLIRQFAIGRTHGELERCLTKGMIINVVER